MIASHNCALVVCVTVSVRWARWVKLGHHRYTLHVDTALQRSHWNAQPTTLVSSSLAALLY